MCKEQTSVSHSSTESEVVSLVAGLRMDGILALDLWEMVIEALQSSQNTQALRNRSLEEINNRSPRIDCAMKPKASIPTRH